MSSDHIIPDRQIRAYFATIIGNARRAHGRRQTAILTPQRPFIELVENSTREGVISVQVNVLDPATLQFTQSNDGAGSTDLQVVAIAGSTFPFVLYSTERLSIQGVNLLGPIRISWGQETY